MNNQLIHKKVGKEKKRNRSGKQEANTKVVDLNPVIL